MKRRNSKTRQSKDDGAVPQDQRKLELTRNIGGGKAVTNDEQTGQLKLFSETAEISQDSDVEMVKTYSSTKSNTGRLSENTEENNLLATMEAVIDQLETAFAKVMANKGSSGVDRQSVGEVKRNWEKIFPDLRFSLQTMDYHPGNIRRVWIPKSGGCQRGLGIPNVIGRVFVRKTLHFLTNFTAAKLARSPDCSRGREADFGTRI